MRERPQVFHPAGGQHSATRNEPHVVAEQSKQKEAEEASETALDEHHEICDNDAWELNRLIHDELEDPFDHMLLDMVSRQSAF